MSIDIDDLGDLVTLKRYQWMPIFDEKISYLLINCIGIRMNCCFQLLCCMICPKPKFDIPVVEFTVFQAAEFKQKNISFFILCVYGAAFPAKLYR